MRAHTVTRMTRPRRYAWCRAPLLIVLSICALAIPASASAHQSPTNATVRDWNRHAVEALSNATDAPTPGAAQTPGVSQLHLAMVQGAVYDAVNAIDGGHQPYLAGLPAASQSASQRAAVATAAHHVLVGLGIGLVPALPEPSASDSTPSMPRRSQAFPVVPRRRMGLRPGPPRPRQSSRRERTTADTCRSRSRSAPIPASGVRPAGGHQRPERMGGQRRAVPHPEALRSSGRMGRARSRAAPTRGNTTR